MTAYGKAVSFAIDYADKDDADDALKTLLIGSLHDEAPDNVTVWDDVPACIVAQWESTRDLIADWALTNKDSTPDPANPPRIHINWTASVPSGQIPWGDNPGEGGYFPMGVTLQMEWIDPTVLIDTP